MKTPPTDPDPGGAATPLVALYSQETPTPRLEDLPGALRRGLEELNLARRIKPGQRVALTAGSRGVTDMARVIRLVADFCRELGAEPYVAPAMGSHGGATAQGQIKVLAGLGITADTVGAPISAHMAADRLGEVSGGLPVYCGQDFTRADQVILVNRIKPHTSFRGRVESGLLKMAAIGMGKRDGARTCHQAFVTRGFEPVVREVAGLVMRRVPVIAAVALLENRLEQTAALEVLDPAEIAGREPALLDMARGLMPRVPFAHVDLLIVDEMGKNISGSGMDSNVTGRIYNQVTPEPYPPWFRRIYVRDLTPQSDGNALGVGTADFAARRLVDKIDPDKTRINCVTASVPEKGRIPITHEHDLPAVGDALASAGVADPAAARLVWIKNTLELSYLWVSAALREEASDLGALRRLSEFGPLPFDPSGDLPFGTHRPPDEAVS